MCHESWDLSVERGGVHRINLVSTRNLVATRVWEQRHLLEYAAVCYGAGSALENTLYNL